MRKIEFYILLDSTFRKGIDIIDAKRKRKAGKNIDSAYNPDTTAIYLACSVNSTFIKVNTGWKIKPAEWNFNLQAPLKKYQNHLELNIFLQKTKLKVERDYLILLINDSPIDVSIIKEIMVRASGGIATNSDKITFWHVFDEFLREKTKGTKAATITKYYSTKKSLIGFEKEHYPLSFDKMTMGFYLDYKTFCAETLQHLNNTISKNLRNIKTFLGWAEVHPNKYITINDYKRFKGETDEPEPIYLNESELERFENFDAQKSISQQKSRDVFVFQCYTGQRIGDVLNMKKQDIRIIDDGPAKEWVLYQQKGNKKYPVYIPILDKAEEILNRYCNDKKDNDLVFSGQCIVMLNKNIKKIAKAVNIDTIITKVNYSGRKRIQKTRPKYNLIGTHTARKTFISLSLQKGMRPEQLIVITGHTSVKQMSPYIGNDKNKLSSDLKEKWNKNGIANLNGNEELNHRYH